MQAQLYMEDFESERSDREAAHGKIADHQKKYAHDVGELKAHLAQMEEHLSHHQDRLEEVEQVNQRRAKEMKSLLEEVSKNQQEVQAKTSQVKQYKKQVDSLKEQVGYSCLGVFSGSRKAMYDTISIDYWDAKLKSLVNNISVFDVTGVFFQASDGV